MNYMVTLRMGREQEGVRRVKNQGGWFCFLALSMWVLRNMNGILTWDWVYGGRKGLSPAGHGSP